MNKSVAFPCFLLGLFLLGWTSISRNVSDQARSMAVDALSPAWRCAEGVKEYLSDRPIAKGKKSESIESSLLKVPIRSALSISDFPPLIFSIKGGKSEIERADRMGQRMGVL